MDQIKIGSFLKELRKEKNLTQESLAEQLGISNRTVSRWETGSNMPDISMLVELAEFYDVSIPEIINGERKSENMNQETKETAEKMAEYSKKETKRGKQKIAGVLMTIFGAFIIASALIMFPSESSWGGTYSLLGGIILIIGVYFLIKQVVKKRIFRILCVVATAVVLFGLFSLSDYLAVAHFHQVPRFRYETAYTSEHPDLLEYKTLFFTAIRKNPGTEQEEVYIAD